MVDENGLLELPKGWVWTMVGEIYDIVGGGTPSTAIAEYWEGDIPWITSADIYGLDDIRPRKKIGLDAIQNSTTNLVPKGSLIVVTRVGLGKIAIADTPLCFSQDSQALIAERSLVYPRYALYCLSQAVQTFKHNSRGTTISGVTKKQLSETSFPLPPLPEQHRIVNKIEELFTRLDAGVDALKKAKAQLKRYRQAVLKAAMAGELTREWREAHRDELEPATVLLERIKEERKKKLGRKYREMPPPDAAGLPELSEGWTWARMHQCCDLITKGESPKWQGYDYVEDGIPFIRSENVSWGKVNTEKAVRIHEDFHRKLSRSQVFASDILINLVGASIGRCGVAPPTLVDANINQAVALIRLSDTFSPHFLMYLLLSPTMQERIHAGKVETARANISLKDLNFLMIPVPPRQEQRIIVEEIERFYSLADEVERVADQSLRQAERLRQSILKRAFEGKLVAQDPLDEPAEKLLERIKAERERQASSVNQQRRRKIKIQPVRA